MLPLLKALNKILCCRACMTLVLCTDFSICCSAVEEAIIALVRLYQQFTLLSENCQEPLDIKQGITMAPRGGVPVYVRQRVKTWNDTVSVAQATA